MPQSLVEVLQARSDSVCGANVCCWNICHVALELDLYTLRCVGAAEGRKAHCHSSGRCCSDLFVFNVQTLKLSRLLRTWAAFFQRLYTLDTPRHEGFISPTSFVQCGIRDIPPLCSHRHLSHYELMPAAGPSVGASMLSAMFWISQSGAHLQRAPHPRHIAIAPIRRCRKGCSAST